MGAGAGILIGGPGGAPKGGPKGKGKDKGRGKGKDGKRGDDRSSSVTSTSSGGSSQQSNSSIKRPDGRFKYGCLKCGGPHQAKDCNKPDPRETNPRIAAIMECDEDDPCGLWWRGASHHGRPLRVGSRRGLPAGDGTLTSSSVNAQSSVAPAVFRVAEAEA